MAETESLEGAMPADVEKTAEELLSAASEKDVPIAVAESCTGGLLASLLTDIPGCSHIFERGFVTYSDAAKCELLGLHRKQIDECGAVSRDVAIAMAQGALDRSNAGLVAALTGFAGPGGDDDEEGLVHIAVARANGEPRHEEFHFGAKGRGPIRLEALRAALAMMHEAF